MMIRVCVFLIIITDYLFIQTTKFALLLRTFLTNAIYVFTVLMSMYIYLTSPLSGPSRLDHFVTHAVYIVYTNTEE